MKFTTDEPCSLLGDALGERVHVAGSPSPVRRCIKVGPLKVGEVGALKILGELAVITRSYQINILPSILRDGNQLWL